jgi:hypothetical protein
MRKEKNKLPMKKTAFILSTLLFAVLFGTMQAKAYDFESICDETSPVGVVEYQGIRYNQCYAAYFDEDDEYMFVSISQNNRVTENHTPTAFDLYFMLKKDRQTFPVGCFQYNALETANENEVIQNAGFVRIHNEWGIAQRSYKSKQLNLSILKLDANRYTIVGQMTLDNPANDTVNFVFSGEINNVPLEVSSISFYIPDDYKNSSGFFTVDNKKIATPFVFQKWNGYEDVTIYLLDRVLCRDRELEYGVSFKLFPKHSIAETFVYSIAAKYRHEAVSCMPAFFNQDRTEYPDEATISISKTKKNEIYQVDYSLKFSDNRIVKGSYTGKIPDRK